MATITSKPTEERRGTFSKRFNWDYFLQDNLTGSRGQMIWVGFLALVTAAFAASGFGSAPGRTGIIVGVWAALIILVVVGELFNLHNPVSRWFKENVFSSIANTLVTLLLSLVIALIIAGLWNWGFVNATFSTELTAPDVRSQTGANWGVLWGARKLLLTGLLDPIYNSRVIWSVAMVAVLWALSFISTRESTRESLSILRKISNIGWLLSPAVTYLLLVGIEYTEGDALIDTTTLISGIVVALALMGLLFLFKVIRLSPVSIAMWVLAWPVAYLIWRLIASTQIFTPINVDDLGGLLLTTIFAIFVNFLSFPVGIALALGRRTVVQGIPQWIVWPVAVIATAYFLATNTPNLWTTSRNNVERILALWPLLIIATAYFFQSSFRGNVVQAFSVLFIEIIRGVPLITLLFMAIVMSPFFSADGVGVKSFWAVVVGFTIFSSAYMAELVRGGLQAIPVGQYEAADALGFNTLQKYRFIVMPQALRILIPPLAGSVIGTFKGSSLVALVGMIDLVGVTRGIIANPQWLGLRTELYVFMFVLYFVVSSVVSWYSRRLEERTGLGVR